MKLVIEIPEGLYNAYKGRPPMLGDEGFDMIAQSIANGTPIEDIGELSDGHHTFNSLYRQRMFLFAALVKAYRDRAWKSLRHEDGELCFGGGWFIVGIDTPEGSYTYHYEDNYYSLFNCEELERGKHWDGHTDVDVKRLMSLALEQEPCEDAISRQAVLSYIYNDLGLGDEENGADVERQIALEESYEYIKSLPPVTPLPKGYGWIPVSERLPEEFESVLVCYKSQGGMAQAVSERFRTHTGYRWSALAGIEPIAWMPLPEPYKADKGEADEKCN